MWFEDNDMLRNRLFGVTRGQPRRPSLKVKLRLGGPQGAQRLAMFALLVAGGLAAVVLIALGVIEAGKRLFSRNHRFSIARLEIETGATVTPDFVKECMCIGEGTNLFAFNITKTREDFLRTPSVKSVAMTRVLPDTLKIGVVERKPLARVGRAESLVADADGVVFRVRSGVSNLPVITGLRTAGVFPGNRLEGMAQCALTVLEMFRCDPVPDLVIDTIDVTSREYLVFRFQRDGETREAWLWWKGMGSNTPESRENLQARLRVFADALHVWPKGRAVMDITTENGNVYFR